MNFTRITLLGFVLLSAGCASNKEYVRQEMAESNAYIAKTCGRNQECRQRLAYAEADRIAADLQERQARKDRFAASMRQMSENQARIAAAQASRPVYVPPVQVVRPTMTNCQNHGQTINCQSY